MADIDGATLNTLVGKMLGDLGGAYSVPTVRIGFRLGLFDALHAGGPATTTELALRAGGECGFDVRLGVDHRGGKIKRAGQINRAVLDRKHHRLFGREAEALAGGIVSGIAVGGLRQCPFAHVALGQSARAQR